MGGKKVHIFVLAHCVHVLLVPHVTRCYACTCTAGTTLLCMYMYCWYHIAMHVHVLLVPHCYACTCTAGTTCYTLLCMYMYCWYHMLHIAMHVHVLLVPHVTHAGTHLNFELHANPFVSSSSADTFSPIDSFAERSSRALMPVSV